MAQVYALTDFLPDWMQNTLDALPSAERARVLAEYDASIQDLLKNLESLRFNQVPDGTGRGQFSVRIPGTNVFINLKSSLWTLAKYGGPLLLASSLAAPLIGALGITVATPKILTTVGSAVAALYQAVAKLKPIEMDTYLAVAATIERNRNQMFDPAGASLPQILATFKREKKSLEKPNDLEAMLDSLVENKVLARKVDTGTKRYYLAF